jgi:hypothetical protein
VQNVEKKQKFPLNLMVLDQFTVGTVIRNIDHQGDIKSLSFFYIFTEIFLIVRIFLKFVQNVKVLRFLLEKERPKICMSKLWQRS